jgi:hypothetical protein
MAEEKTYDMRPSPLATTGVYYPLRFRIGPPSKTRARGVAALLLGQYAGRYLTFEQWRKAGDLTVTWKDDTGQDRRSRPFKFEWLASHVRDREQFLPEEFELPPLASGWLDASIEVKQPFHAPATDGSNDALTFMFPPPLSSSFPVQPKLDREGRAFSSLQLMLLQSWLDLRNRLVEQSHLLFEGYDWLRDLFLYVSTVVSTVDNTLHQIYYRAKYEAVTEGWTFNEATLGLPYARRLKDKLRWVGQLTGQPLDDCRDLVDAFVKIKDVRNHLIHFDPPILAFTIEDISQWLNATESVAQLLVAIRRRVRQPIPAPLFRLLLARPVDWYPFDAGKRRTTQSADVGYASSRW